MPPASLLETLDRAIFEHRFWKGAIHVTLQAVVLVFFILRHNEAIDPPAWAVTFARLLILLGLSRSYVMIRRS